MTPSTHPPSPAAQAFAFRAVGDFAAAMTAPLLYIGDRFGLFKRLASTGPITVEDLARQAELQPRYVREWASGLVAAEYLQYHPETRLISLDADHAEVLANEDSPFFVGGLAEMVPDQYRVLPDLLRAFKEGGGVPYTQFTQDTIEGTERLFRPGYRNFLTQVWIPAMPDVHRKLMEGAKVADVGCGRGQAPLYMARAFPRSTFIGWDNYAPAIEYAQEMTRREGLEDRLRFEVRSSTDLPASGDFDLITTCDCLHDMASPEGSAQAIRQALKPDGTWFCIEPHMSDRLEENINPIGRLFYGFSMMQCMTVSLACHGAGYGAGMGPGILRRIAEEAGFTRFRRLEIDNPFNQFFQIQP